MAATSRHLRVPTTEPARAMCLGADGSAAVVGKVIGMIDGRWKLPIVFRLFERTTVRTLELKRDMPGVSQKMLTQHLRELEADGLVVRAESGGKLRKVEYRLSATGAALRPALRALREFGDICPATRSHAGGAIEG